MNDTAIMEQSHPPTISLDTSHQLDEPHTSITCKTSETPDRWSEPIRFDILECPDQLDESALPSELYHIAKHFTEVLQVPIELAVSLMLPTLTTAIGSKAGIELATHTEPSPLWTCCILEPGSRKSSAFALITKPLRDAEAELQATWREDQMNWKAKAEVAECEVQKIHADIKKYGQNEEHVKRIVAARKVIKNEPPCPHLWCEDTTSERLRSLLSENGSIGVFSAEGGSVFAGPGRYTGNSGADLGVWLAGHAGDAGKSTRISGHVQNDSQQLSVCLTAQRDVLKDVGQDRLLRERGFLHRFFWLIPTDPRGTRKYREQVPLSQPVIDAWDQLVRRIIDIEKKDKPLCITLSEEAREFWLDFAEELEKRQAPGMDLRDMAGWASKLAGGVGRIALSFHFATGLGIEDTLRASEMRASITLGRILIKHAKIAFSIMGETGSLARARHIAEKIAYKGLTSISPRILVTNGWGGVKTAREAREVIEILESRFYLRKLVESPNAKGGRPAENYEVNPRVLQVMQVLQASGNGLTSLY